MPFSMRIYKSAPIEMRDGTKLRGDIYRPDDKARHPALLMRGPYERKMIFDSYLSFCITAVEAGYVVINQSQRGTWDSEGQNTLGEPGQTAEFSDGYDTVEWMASQPWCDGNVGTFGGSALGRIQWTTARANPPHLKAIAPWIEGNVTSDPSRVNGVVSLLPWVKWLLKMTVADIDRQEKLGKDVSAIRELLSEAVVNPEKVYNFLPLKDIPYFNFDGIKEMFTNRILDNSRDTLEYFEKTRTPYEMVQVPCFHVGGWFDYYPAGTLNHFLKMREKGGSKLARDNQHVLMGPWTHMMASKDGDAGALGFGDLASKVGTQLEDYTIAFFNKYLRGMNTDLPAVRYFVMGKNIWRNADEWPLPETKWQRFFLHSRGHANSAQGDGWLSRDEPGSEPPDIFIYNPNFPVPTNGCRGQHQLFTFAPTPQEQSIVERRNDVLCYTTPELKEDLEVTGPLKLHLFASTSARDTDFIAKLIDVYPSGQAYDLVVGIIRARYRKSLFAPEPVSPGEVNEYVIDLEAVSQLFRKGHRIRIDITSSNFPDYDRNMNTGNAIGEDAQGIPALQTIYHQSGYFSYIELPVFPG